MAYTTKDKQGQQHNKEKLGSKLKASPESGYKRNSSSATRNNVNSKGAETTRGASSKHITSSARKMDRRNSTLSNNWRVEKTKRQERKADPLPTNPQDSPSVKATNSWSVMDSKSMEELEEKMAEVEHDVKEAVIEFEAKNGRLKQTHGRNYGVYGLPESSDGSRNKKKSISALKKAQEEFDARIKRKNAEVQRRLNEEAEKRKKIEENAAKRKENFKIFSRKTRNGQPLMGERMSLLLKKIQNMSN